MKFYTKGTIFEKLLKHRKSLILQFMQGDINKREYILENYRYIQSLRREPYQKIDSFEKGFFNYQYYNSLAKYYRMEASYVKSKRDLSDPEERKYYKGCLDKSNDYYKLKDKNALKVLEIIDFSGVKAYYIKTQSPYFQGNLVEIVLHEYDNIIFHSRSPFLLDRLKQAGVFHEEVRKSIVDNYINQKY